MLRKKTERELAQGREHLRPEGSSSSFRRLAGRHDLAAPEPFIEDGRRHVHDLELGHLVEERVIDDVVRANPQQWAHAFDRAPDVGEMEGRDQHHAVAQESRHRFRDRPSLRVERGEIVDACHLGVALQQRLDVDDALERR